MELENSFLEKLLKTAKDAARLAAEQALKEQERIEISIKGETDLVTQADTMCQQIIIDRINADFAGHGFIAEEGQGGELFKVCPEEGQDFWWIIDPIDGTNNFAHKMPIFTISIAVMHEGRPIVGVIYDPGTDSMYEAREGSQAMCNGEAISAGQGELNMFASVGLDSHFNGTVPGWAQEMILNFKVRSLGTTALHFAYVSKGSFVGALTPKTKLWDIAAGSAIALGAGALVTDFGGDAIFPLDLEDYQGGNLQVVAANEKVHGDLVGLLGS